MAVVAFRLKLYMYGKSKITDMKSKSNGHVITSFRRKSPTAFRLLYDRYHYTVYTVFCQDTFKSVCPHSFYAQKNRSAVDKPKRIVYNKAVEATV